MPLRAQGTKALQCGYSQAISCDCLAVYTLICMTVIPGHPASFTHNLASRMQSFNFDGSQDVMFFADLH